jgi:lysine-N-methylase
MTRFRCLGAACEDSCCHGWRIIVDKEHHDRLRGRMRSPAERAELDAALEPVERKRATAHRHALIVLRADGRCSFLADDGLCTIHGRYGEELLADTCATYPRVLGQIGDRLELVGALSCPEIARLVLLHDDATELAAAEPTIIGRGWVRRAIAVKGKDPYEQSFVAVRRLAIDLASTQRFPLASRLFFLAFLADRSRAELRRGAARADAAALEALLDRLEVAENLAELHRQYRRSLADDEFAFWLLRELLVLAAPIMPAPLRQLLDELAARGARLDGDAAALQRAYQELPPLAPPLAARLDLLLGRYVAHDLLRTWYVEEPSFIGYVHGLLARVALVKLLVGADARLAPEPLDPDALDARVARVVYLLSRMFEHSDGLVAQLRRGLEGTGMELAHAIALTHV